MVHELLGATGVEQWYSCRTYLILLFGRLCLGEGDSGFEDAQDQGADPASMCRDVASAAEVTGLKSS